MSVEPLTIEVDAATRVSALLQRPDGATRLFVFAHGAGAGMHHAFMTAFADGLAARGVATLRYQFPFIERGARRTDPPAVAHATVRAAVHEAARRCPALPRFAGGKSFGGRMTSQADAIEPLPGVRGLVFAGFPLHPPDQPGVERAAHLARVALPMLFLQGTRDALAELALVRATVDGLGPRATLVVVDDADHAFHVRQKTSGRDDAAALAEMLDATVGWLAAAGGRAPG